MFALHRKGKLKERKGRETGTQKGIECEKERERVKELTFETETLKKEKVRVT